MKRPMAHAPDPSADPMAESGEVASASPPAAVDAIAAAHEAIMLLVAQRNQALDDLVRTQVELNSARREIAALRAQVVASPNGNTENRQAMERAIH